MKLILFTFTAFILVGCSTTTIKSAYNATKRASYNAVTDYGTLIPAAGATLLYVTNSDTRLANYFIENEIIERDHDELYRSINGYETYITGLLIKDDSYLTKAERVLVEFGAFKVGVFTSDALNDNIDKRSPNGANYGIGSQHAIGPFVGAAMTRRNVEQLEIPLWSKLALNTLSYSMATASAITRVEDSGHTVADQLVSVTLGNMIGIFFNDLFLLKETPTTLSTSLTTDSAYLNLTYRY
ncbi:hypothetical protein [Sulfurimonas sp.]